MAVTNTVTIAPKWHTSMTMVRLVAVVGAMRVVAIATAAGGATLLLLVGALGIVVATVVA